MNASFFSPIVMNTDSRELELTLMGGVYTLSLIATFIWTLITNCPTPVYQEGDFVRLLVSGEVGQVTKSSCRAFNAECSYNIRVGNHDTVTYKAFELDADIHIQPGN